LSEHDYHPVTEVVLGELRAIVGEANVIADPELMIDYGHDEVAGEEHAHMPEAVVKPETAEEISQIVQLAVRERIPVTPRGAGSGLSGGAVPVYGGIVLSVERMNRILEVDRENMVAVVEPGVITNEINEEVAPYGLFYAGYPMSRETCFVGGNLAENAGGGRAIKYGVTGRYVLGLEVVLPTGEIVRLGGKRVKDVTGYDLIHLLIGSEGTLGIFTEVTLKLIPLPAARMVLLIPFADVRSAIDAVPQIMTQGRLIPTAVEFMDRLTVETVYQYLEEDPPHPDIGAMLLIEVDGPNQEQVEAMLEPIVDLCLELGAFDVYVGNNPTNIERMWHVRESIADAFKAICPVQSIEDIVVPLAQIPDLIPALEALSAQYNVVVPCYGHAGDGNLHATVVKGPEMPMEEWHEVLPDVLADLYRLVDSLGGTISGEHGIGSKRREYLPLVMDPALIRLQRQIKQAFDPHGILNPGKIFA
jgi:glycolate oxidase